MSGKTQSVLLGGLVIALAATIVGFLQFSVPQQVQPVFGCLTCILFIGTGLLAVWHYTSTNGLTIPGGEGAGMGALSGVIAAIAAFVIAWALRAVGVFPSVEEMIEMAMQGQEIPPESREMMETMAGFSSGIGGLLVNLLFGVIAGAIGGAIGAAVFKKGGEPVDEF